MRLFTKRGAVTAFYYLMAADGEIGAAELEKLDEIGRELDPEHYAEYRERIAEAYEQQIAAAFADDEPYDLLSEGVDRALAEVPADDEEGVTPRLLLWDMLVMAGADGQFHPLERRLIKHVARISSIEKSVFLEMEQLIQTGNAIAKELAWLSASERPYAEVRPMVEELQKRQQMILTEAKTLIEDEAAQRVEALTYKPDLIDTAKEKLRPVATEIGDKTAQAVSSAKEKLTPVASELGEKAGKAFGEAKDKLLLGFKGLKKKGQKAEEPMDEEAD